MIISENEITDHINIQLTKSFYIILYLNHQDSYLKYETTLCFFCSETKSCFVHHRTDFSKILWNYKFIIPKYLFNQFWFVYLHSCLKCSELNNFIRSSKTPQKSKLCQLTSIFNNISLNLSIFSILIQFIYNSNLFFMKLFIPIKINIKLTEDIKFNIIRAIMILVFYITKKIS